MPWRPSRAWATTASSSWRLVVEAVRPFDHFQRAGEARHVRDRDLSRERVLRLDLAQRPHQAAHDRAGSDDDALTVAREYGLHRQLDAAAVDPLLHDALDLHLQRLQPARDVDADVEVAVVEAADGHGA